MNKKPWQDNKGHFTFEENDGGECPHNSGTKEYRQNTPYEELTKPQGNGKIQLSNREWAMFYAKLGEIERGGYVDLTSDGNQLIKIGNKVVVTAGTYEEPKVLQVVTFDSEEKLYEFLEWSTYE